ncbi:MAG TPA: RidA family protein [Candidatus Dormibacteraeota bacterium]
MSQAHERLRELGLELPQPPAALAAYVPTRSVPIGDGRAVVYIAGQVPMRDGKPLHAGSVPDEVSVEEARECARLCALNVLAQLEAASGLDNVEQVLQVTGYVLSSPGFGEQPDVINACSDLLVEVLGEPGRHTRAAVGVNALPRSVAVEISAIAQVRLRS